MQAVALIFMVAALVVAAFSEDRGYRFAAILLCGFLISVTLHEHMYVHPIF